MRREENGTPAYRTQVINVERQPEAGTIQAAKLIQNGEVVAFPTETVYGLGANGLCGEAVAKIFAAKGRPADNPLIEHVSKKSDVRRLWMRTPKFAQILMDTFWPGPLTLIAQKSDCVPDEVTAGLNTVAVRMPLNKTARALISKAGVPIAAPSANRSGRPSPTTAQHVLDDMDGRIPLILDGGPCEVGLESTVLDMTAEPPAIVRPGGVTREMLAAVLPAVAVAGSVMRPLARGEKAVSPGMMYRHYAPKGQMTLVRGAPENVRETCLRLYREARTRGEKARVLAPAEHAPWYEGCEALAVGSLARPETVAHELFAALRRMDDEGVAIIVCEAVEPEGIGLAILNRLYRAAAFRVLEV